MTDHDDPRTLADDLRREAARAEALGVPAGHRLAEWLRDLAPLAEAALRQAEAARVREWDMRAPSDQTVNSTKAPR